MKMKKIIFMFLFCFSFCLLSSAAYADLKEPTQIEITGGVDFEKEKISTFDDAKQISGTAECGTAISIKVYTVTSKGKLLEKESYEIEVGKSGIFSQNVELRLGENLVELTALQQGKEETVQEITVNRKKSSIKRKLQSEMYLPGSGI